MPNHFMIAFDDQMLSVITALSEEFNADAGRVLTTAVRLLEATAAAQRAGKTVAIMDPATKTMTPISLVALANDAN